ncbi:MAG: hypothetical protein OXO50_03775, partial [Caldilineaceae bacterium]|nr:hypothetical protein [Caldilineaceae bacterium]
SGACVKEGKRTAVVSGQWAVVSGQWSVVSGRWSVVGGQWSEVVPGLPETGAGRVWLPTKEM